MLCVLARLIRLLLLCVLRLRSGGSRYCRSRLGLSIGLWLWLWLGLRALGRLQLLLLRVSVRIGRGRRIDHLLRGLRGDLCSLGLIRLRAVARRFGKQTCDGRCGREARDDDSACRGRDKRVNSAWLCVARIVHDDLRLEQSPIGFFET